MTHYSYPEASFDPGDLQVPCKPLLKVRVHPGRFLHNIWSQKWPEHILCSCHLNWANPPPKWYHIQHFQNLWGRWCRIAKIAVFLRSSCLVLSVQYSITFTISFCSKSNDREMIPLQLLQFYGISHSETNCQEDRIHTSFHHTVQRPHFQMETCYLGYASASALDPTLPVPPVNHLWHLHSKESAKGFFLINKYLLLFSIPRSELLHGPHEPKIVEHRWEVMNILWRYV